MLAALRFRAVDSISSSALCWHVIMTLPSSPFSFPLFHVVFSG
jgi:hypothetical protein